MKDMPITLALLISRDIHARRRAAAETKGSTPAGGGIVS